MKERDCPYVDEHEFNCEYVKPAISKKSSFIQNKEKPRMTCFEKIKSEHPDWDEKTLYEYTHWNCPSYLKLADDPDYCMNGAVAYQCTDCWNREMEE